MKDPVVVGVDGAASGLVAVDVAAREARLRGAPLRMVHALGPPAGAAAWRRGLKPLARGVLARAEGRACAAAPGLEISRSVVAGDPRQVLEIESRSAALVVLGTAAVSGSGGLPLGSTAAHLAVHGHCPLLVARGRVAASGPVLVAVDGSPAGEAAVAFAFAEAALREAPLVALHVWNSWSEHAYEGAGDPLTAVVSDVEHVRAAEQRLLHETVARWQEFFPHVAAERRVMRSRIRTALIDASGTAQLMVAGAGGHGGLTGLLTGSVGQALLRHAQCPVAVVRGGRP
ncbi:universal stress protein [Streptomyces sp. enrichment culture]|uniref:universal stress protein n=1 Tax=Streptomyces sp. enrichment culture TaxID=1795815 RepID=UPI003F57080D